MISPVPPDGSRGRIECKPHGLGREPDSRRHISRNKGACSRRGGGGSSPSLRLRGCPCFLACQWTDCDFSNIGLRVCEEHIIRASGSRETRRTTHSGSASLQERSSHQTVSGHSNCSSCLAQLSGTRLRRPSRVSSLKKSTPRPPRRLGNSLSTPRTNNPDPAPRDIPEPHVEPSELGPDDEEHPEWFLWVFDLGQEARVEAE